MFNSTDQRCSVIGPGICTVAANQEGDAACHPAPHVTQSLTVHPAPILGINADGTLPRRTGVATVSGTVTCAIPMTLTLNVTLEQQQTKGRTTTTVSGSQGIVASSRGATAWMAEITPEGSAKFFNGAASATPIAAGISPERTVQLR